MSKKQQFVCLHNLPNFTDLNDQEKGAASDRRPGQTVWLDPGDDGTKRLLRLNAIDTYKPQVGEVEEDTAGNKTPAKDKDAKHAELVKLFASLDIDEGDNFENGLPKRQLIDKLTSFKATDAQVKAAWKEVE